MTAAASVSDLIAGIKIIDADTHLSEPHDLWTSRAPARLKDKVPRVKISDGKRRWVIDDDIPLSDGASPISVIRKDGSKSRSLEFFGWQIEDVHAGAYNTQARLKVMDETNIFAQIVYPNVLGFGGQNATKVDQELRIASIQIFNDAMAEIQAESKGRIFPMALLPWWDVDASAKETERCKAMGLRGVNINSDPHNLPGTPDLTSTHWDKLWETCAGIDMPVNFHIGASDSAIAWYGTSFWPGQPQDIQFAIGSSMLFFGNARVMANILLSGILDRHPTIKFVSVESGIGWIPFLLETIEYQLAENAAGRKFSLTPSEYFDRNVWSSFWFERRNIADTIRQVGADKVMFETD
ncbi:MAG TPA: amidohydrolase family protein, partial [Alphaproteobacteria bacterium]|nr:amidohydrolase family protein [Alphaproteobacteria bacterium]